MVTFGDMVHIFGKMRNNTMKGNGKRCNMAKEYSWFNAYLNSALYFVYCAKRCRNSPESSNQSMYSNSDSNITF